MRYELKYTIHGNTEWSRPIREKGQAVLKVKENFPFPGAVVDPENEI